MQVENLIFSSTQPVLSYPALTFAVSEHKVPESKTFLPCFLLCSQCLQKHLPCSKCAGSICLVNIYHWITNQD